MTTTREAPLIRLERVGLDLGGTPVLHDVDLEVRDLRAPGRVLGQVVALLGPSGIGKTRLLRLLAGLDSPDRGRVLVGEGQQPARPGSAGLVGQASPLFDHRRVLDNLELAARQGGQSGAAASELLARLGLASHAQAWPAQLSGGQRQRVAIAQQVLAGSRVLLMDEPFSGLDPVAIDAVLELIAEVAALDEMSTVVVATHDVDAAVQVADMVVLLGRSAEAPGARVREVRDLAEAREQHDWPLLRPRLAAELRGAFRDLARPASAAGRGFAGC